MNYQPPQGSLGRRQLQQTKNRILRTAFIQAQGHGYCCCSGQEEKGNVEREEQNGGHGGQEEWVLVPREAQAFQGSYITAE